MVSNNFCALPFGHTRIGTTGDFAVCCYHLTPEPYRININNNKIDHWLESDYLKEVKQSFRDGQQHPGCSTCWKSENLGLSSMRNRITNEYQILGVNESTNYPVNIEIQLGNLCNLKCLMCNENWSSSILAENIKLKINTHQQKDFQWSSEGFDNLEEIIAQGPRVLNIRGGEPFYNKDLLQIIENLSTKACNQTVLHITTNATQWSDRWTKALTRFKLIRIMFSIDAIGDLYEYIRFPASWTDTQTNINEMVKCSNIKPMVHCTVQNLNIGVIGSVIQWSKEKKLYLQLEQLSQPDWLILTNLPRQSKINAIQHLENVLQWDLPDYLKQQIVSYHTQITESLTESTDSLLWTQFRAHITLRDQHRNNSYKRFLLD